MKNSPKHNPAKDVAAPGKQKQKWPANRAGTYKHSPIRPPQELAPGARQPAVARDPGVRSSRPLVAKQDNVIPSSAAQGDDDIMSQEKT